MRKIQFDFLSIKGNYKNAEIEIIVEDDVITTKRVFMDGECVICDDVYDINDKEVPYTSKNMSAVTKLCVRDVDRILAEDGRTECTNMALVQR